jgi:hypothetical protein
MAGSPNELHWGTGLGECSSAAWIMGKDVVCHDWSWIRSANDFGDVDTVSFKCGVGFVCW